MSPSLHDLAALGSPRARRARSGTSASPSGSGIIAGQVSFPYSPSEPTLAAQLQNFIDALEHAERQGKQYPAAELDQKFQPQVVAAQNHIHPNLKVKVFDASHPSRMRCGKLLSIPGGVSGGAPSLTWSGSMERERQAMASRWT